MSKQPHTSIDNLESTLHTLGGLTEALDMIVHGIPVFTASSREAQVVQALIDSISAGTKQAVTHCDALSRTIECGKADV